MGVAKFDLAKRLEKKSIVEEANQLVDEQIGKNIFKIADFNFKEKVKRIKEIAEIVNKNI